MNPIGDKTRHLFRHSLGPLFLLVCAPPTTLLVWAINVRYDGSLLAFAEQALAVGVLSELASIWGPYVWGTAAGWKIISVFAALQLLLMRLVPGKRFHGPMTPNGHVPEYRANGVACFLITIGLFLGGSYGLQWFDPAIVYDNFPSILGALNVFGVSLCLLLYVKGWRFPSGPDHGISGNFLFDYYWGTELYPRILGWDVKVFTNCRFGMTGWAVIVLSFAAKHVELNGSMSDSMIVAVIIMMAYLVKFFVWETGYLCTKDIMHDRAGFLNMLGMPGLAAGDLYFANSLSRSSSPSAGPGLVGGHNLLGVAGSSDRLSHGQTTPDRPGYRRGLHGLGQKIAVH